MGNPPASHASGARRDRCAILWALVVLAGCSTSVAPVRTIPQAPHPTPAAKVCTDDVVPRSVLIADWPEPLRNELFSAMSRGHAYVKLTCEGIALVRSCSSPGRYDEASTHGANDRSWSTRWADAGSSLPLRGQALERSIEGGGTIAFASRDTVLHSIAVPSDGSPVATEDELLGGCDGVTHVVTRVHVGEVSMAARTIDATWPEPIDAPMPEGFSPLLRASLAPFAIDLVPVSRRRVVDVRSRVTPLADPVSTTDTNDRAQACERGSAIDCTLSAGGSQERLERACHLGDAAGCERAGLALLSPNVGTARADDVSSAIAMLERACDARDALACSRAGAVLDAGKTIPRDAARATRLLTRACREGDATSCVRAGTMLAKGDGIERDDVRANELLERACNLGDGYRKACFDLARRVASGQGGVPDLRRAADLYLRGCAPPESTDESEEGNHSCSRAGSMYETGDGVKKDFERGMTLHLLACRRTGDKRSCFAAGNWLEKRSRGRGVALYQEVCRKFQLKEACQRSHLVMARSTIGRSTVVESFGAFGVEQPRAPGLGVFAEIATRHRLEALMSDRRGQVRFAPFGHVARQIIDEVLEEGGSSHAPGSKAGSLNISERCVGFVATWCQARDEVRRRTILRRENASAVEIRASDVTIRHRSSHDIFTPRVAHVARCLAGDGMFDPHASDERHLDVDPCPGLVGRRGCGDGHEEATRAVGE